MVGRLIENQQVGVFEEYLRQCHPLALAAGKCSVSAVGMVNAQASEDLLGFVLKIPRIEFIHILHHLRELVVVVAFDRMLVALHHLRHRIIGRKYYFQDRE